MPNSYNIDQTAKVASLLRQKSKLRSKGNITLYGGGTKSPIRPGVIRQIESVYFKMLGPMSMLHTEDGESIDVSLLGEVDLNMMIMDAELRLSTAKSSSNLKDVELFETLLHVFKTERTHRQSAYIQWNTQDLFIEFKRNVDQYNSNVPSSPEQDTSISSGNRDAHMEVIQEILDELEYRGYYAIAESDNDDDPNNDLGANIDLIEPMSNSLKDLEVPNDFIIRDVKGIFMYDGLGDDRPLRNATVKFLWKGSFQYSNTSRTSQTGEFSDNVPKDLIVSNLSIHISKAGCSQEISFTIAKLRALKGNLGTIVLDRQFASVEGLLEQVDNLAQSMEDVAWNEQARSPQSPPKITFGEGDSSFALAVEMSPSTYTYDVLHRLVEPNLVKMTDGILKEVDRKTLSGPVSISKFRENLLDDPLSNATMATLGIGYIISMQQTWIPSDFVLGDMLYSLALAPGEEQRIIMSEKSEDYMVTDEEELSISESESHVWNQSNNLSALYRSALDEMMNASTKMESKVTGGGTGLIPSMFVSSNTNNAKASSDSSQNSSRSEMSSLAEDFTEEISRQANNQRESSRVGIRMATSDDSASITSKVIANHNHSHSLTMQYWEVVRNYIISTRVANVRLVCYVPFKPISFLPKGQSLADGLKADEGMDLDMSALSDLEILFGILHYGAIGNFQLSDDMSSSRTDTYTEVTCTFLDGKESKVTKTVKTMINYAASTTEVKDSKGNMMFCIRYEGGISTTFTNPEGKTQWIENGIEAEKIPMHQLFESKSSILKEEFYARYKVLLEYHDSLRMIMPGKYARGLKLLKKYATYPKWDYMGSKGNKSARLILSVRAGLLSYHEISARLCINKHLERGNSSFSQVVRIEGHALSNIESESHFERSSISLLKFLKEKRKEEREIKFEFHVPPEVRDDDYICVELEVSYPKEAYYRLHQNEDDKHLIEQWKDAIYKRDEAYDKLGSSVFGNILWNEYSKKAEKIYGNLPECIKFPDVKLNKVQFDAIGAPSIFEVKLSKADGVGTYVEHHGYEELTSRCTYKVHDIMPSMNYEELQEIESTLRHVVENTIMYSQAIWASVSPEERAMLLERYTFASSKLYGSDVGFEVPLMNCVANSIEGFYGNCMIMPFTYPPEVAAKMGTSTKKAQDAIFRYHTEAFRPPEVTISVPTGGMIGEAVLGGSNASEKIDITRFWNWQDSPIDHATEIKMNDLKDVSLLSGAGAPSDLVGLSQNFTLDDIGSTQLPAVLDALAKDKRAFKDATNAKNLTDHMTEVVNMATEERKNALAKRVQIADGMIEIAKDKLTDYMKESTPTGKADKELEKAKEEKAIQAKNKESEMILKDVELTNKNDDIYRLSKEKATIDADLLKAQKEMDAIDTAAIDAELEKIKKEIGETSDEDKKKELEEKKAKLESDRKAKDDLEERKAQLEKDKEAKEAESSKLEAEAKSLEADIKNLEAWLEDNNKKEDKAAQRKDSILKMYEKGEELKGKVKAKDSASNEIAKIEASLAEIEEKLKTASGDEKKKLEENKADLEKKKKSKEGEVKELDKEIKALETDIEKLKKWLEANPADDTAKATKEVK